MSSLLQPTIFDPQLTPINRYADIVEGEAIAWVLQFHPGLAQTPARLRKLRAAKFARLAARALPRAPLAELRLVCDFITWLFFYDDAFCDRSAGTPDPLGRLRIAQQRMLAVLRGAPSRTEDGPLVAMLADLGRRITAWAEPGFMPRFVGTIERYFQSNVWELGNLVSKRAPPGPLYLKMRPFTGGVGVVLDLFELIAHGSLLAVREHVLVQQLELLANNCICWANDVGSLGKEMQEGNPHNLVLVLSRDHGLRIEGALERARGMLVAEEAAFDVLAEQLLVVADPSDLHLRAHVANLRSFVRGNLVWMRETTRYRAPRVVAGRDGAAA